MDSEGKDGHMAGMEAPAEVRKEVIAVAGKGGAGKTTITALMAGLIARQGHSILAVDADPPTALAYALGMENFSTVGEIRHRIIADPEVKRRLMGDRHMRDVIAQEALVETDGISLLVVGQGEGPGCYCGLNELLKFGIDSLSEKFAYTLVDCEAGIEQVNRRVVNKIDTLIMVSDPTIKGLRTAAYLKKIADQYGIMGKYRGGLVINRANGDLDSFKGKIRETGLDLWGVVPMDPNVADHDLHGKPIVDLPDDSPSLAAVRDLLRTLQILP